MIYHLIKSWGKLGLFDAAILLLFPAVGLGRWIHTRTELIGEPTDFPRKWFIWRYMVKVNWGYFALISILPLIGLILMAFGTALAGFFGLHFGEFSRNPEILSLLEAGLVMVILFYFVVMVIVMALPYLVLIYLPKRQYKQIEKQILWQKVNANQQSVNQPEEPFASYTGQALPVFPDVLSYIEPLKSDFEGIAKERKKDLDSVAFYLRRQLADGKTVNLMFICTHNSRRSQFGQIWAAVAAAHFGIRNIQTFSGGTEETAFNKRAVEAIQRAGMKVSGTVGTNPRYSIRFSDEVGALDCYSKTFDTSANPQKGFVAIMTCSDADEACPIVPGADFRTRIAYEDPKVADRTVQEREVYDERCKQIATEMLYLFSKVAE